MAISETNAAGRRLLQVVLVQLLQEGGRVLRLLGSLAPLGSWGGSLGGPRIPAPSFPAARRLGNLPPSVAAGLSSKAELLLHTPVCCRHVREVRPQRNKTVEIIFNSSEVARNKKRHDEVPRD